MELWVGMCAFLLSKAFAISLFSYDILVTNYSTQTLQINKTDNNHLGRGGCLGED